ncbi:DUF6510 family protein [Actinoplanes sp. NPDC049596]|uniref:DUF6510 family protein n=1 Tax=unclassified Actinoplanes TaxID=2626549 RepID=UPI0034451DED
MNALDGNAVATLLHDLFGQEMTGVAATCAHCAKKSVLARVKVFRGAGTVLLCSGCDGRLMVIVDREGVACVDAEGFSALAVRVPQPMLVADLNHAGVTAPGSAGASPAS